MKIPLFTLKNASWLAVFLLTYAGSDARWNNPGEITYDDLVKYPGKGLSDPEVPYIIPKIENTAQGLAQHFVFEGAPVLPCFLEKLDTSYEGAQFGPLWVNVGIANHVGKRYANWTFKTSFKNDFEGPIKDVDGKYFVMNGFRELYGWNGHCASLQYKLLGKMSPDTWLLWIVSNRGGSAFYSQYMMVKVGQRDFIKADAQDIEAKIQGNMVHLTPNMTVHTLTIVGYIDGYKNYIENFYIHRNKKFNFDIQHFPGKDYGPLIVSGYGDYKLEPITWSMEKEAWVPITPNTIFKNAQGQGFYWRKGAWQAVAV